MMDLDDLTLYAYGLLDESSAAEIRDHAAGCPDCASRIAQLAAEHSFLGACLRPETRPPNFGIDARELPRPWGGLPG